MSKRTASVLVMLLALVGLAFAAAIYFLGEKRDVVAWLLAAAGACGLAGLRQAVKLAEKSVKA